MHLLTPDLGAVCHPCAKYTKTDVEAQGLWPRQWGGEGLFDSWWSGKKALKRCHLNFWLKYEEPGQERRGHGKEESENGKEQGQVSKGLVLAGLREGQ